MEFDDVLNMVRQKAFQYSRKGIVGREIEDLIQDGFLIFKEAQDRFDPDKGVLFSTYFYQMLTSRFNSKAVSSMLRVTEPLSDILQEIIMSGKLSDFHLQDLSEDASYVCSTILNGTFTRLTKTEIRTWLYDQGWQVKRVNETFKEIEGYVNSL